MSIKYSSFLYTGSCRLYDSSVQSPAWRWFLCTGRQLILQIRGEGLENRRRGTNKSNVVKNIPAGILVPSNLLISSGGINFVIPAANFFCQVYFIRYHCSKTLLRNPFSVDFILGQKVVNVMFSEYLCFVRFGTKLILKSQRNLLKNINKKATKNTAIPMENASNILNRRCSLSMGFCDKITPPPPQPSHFFRKLKVFFPFLVIF